MKAFASFVVLSLIVAGSAVGLYVRRESQASAMRLDRQTAAMEELAQKLESLGERLEGVERSARNAPVVALTANPAVGAAQTADGAEEPAGGAAEAPLSLDDRDANAQAFTRQLVATLGKDGESQFRDYVREVYTQERNARREREAADAEAQRKELEELGKGPYGKYNRRVNTLGKQLALDDRQKQRYHDLLDSYTSRLGEMRKAVDWKDKGARQGFRDTENALQSEFDAHVAHLLSQQQQEDYAAMHPVEKSLGAAEGGAVFFKMGEGGAGMALPDIMVDGHREAAVRVYGAAAGAAEDAAIDLGIKLEQAAAEAARAQADKEAGRARAAPPGGE